MIHTCDKCHSETTRIYFYKVNEEYEAALLCKKCLLSVDKKYYKSILKSEDEWKVWKTKLKKQVDLNLLKQDFSTGVIDYLLS